MLVQILQQIPDKRRAQGKVYEQYAILFIAIFSIISNSKSYRQIEIFSKVHLKSFKKYLKLEWKKAPDYGTIRNVICELDTDDLEKAFRNHATIMHEPEIGDQVCIDGKTVRKSFDKYKGKEALQVLSTFFTSDLIVSGHEFFEKDKTNEIPRLRKLIKELGLEDAFITADAMHTQLSTVKQIEAQECEYVVQVKDNQKTLHEACENICNSYNPAENLRQRDLGHGRSENRYYHVYNNPIVLDRHVPKLWKPYIKAIIQVSRNTIHYNPKGVSYTKTSEVSYYISTENNTALFLGKKIRNQWCIENKLHYVKDVSMEEDSSRIRIKPENMVILRDWALNILRKNMEPGVYVKTALFENSLNIGKVMRFKHLFP